MADAEHHVPGEPPEIRDEAADTPMWVPAFGLALLIFGAVFLVWQSANDDDADATETEQVDEAAADEAPEGADDEEQDVQ